MSEDESYLVKPKDPLEIMRSQDRGALTQFLKDPRSAIAGALIETFSHGPGAFTGSLVKIAIAALNGRAQQQFAEEIKDFQAKGKIADDWAEKPKGYQTWVELLRAIDEESPDEEKLDALKAMFFAANKVKIKDGERILAYQLFQIAKRLSSGELLLLKTIDSLGYNMQQLKQQPAFIALDEWESAAAQDMGHALTALIRHHEKALIENDLIQPRANESRQVMTPNGRVTDLGLKFCENIQQYQLDKRSE